MTVMGMAASQARFLGLTARKSNVEYQGQQVNQQRTSLANESANLYNQMMELDVPTPPSTNDYYQTTYVLEGTGNDYDEGAYRIENINKTYDENGEYSISLAKTIEKKAHKPETYTINNYLPSTKEDEPTKIDLSDGVNNPITLEYLLKDGQMPSAYKDGNLVSDIKKYQLYELEFGTEENPNALPEGYEECAAKEQGLKYFYKDAAAKYHFMTEDDFKTITTSGNNGSIIGYSTTYDKKEDVTTDVVGYLEKSSNGRYTSIKISVSDKNPELLQGLEFSLATTQEFNEEEYNQAMNDYEYNKALYEKSISDINAKTEIIQKQDQQLELRLQQLSTEQNAIATEMDSVTKVIEDNVEKTFKVFA